MPTEDQRSAEQTVKPNSIGAKVGNELSVSSTYTDNDPLSNLSQNMLSAIRSVLSITRENDFRLHPIEEMHKKKVAGLESISKYILDLNIDQSRPADGFRSAYKANNKHREPELLSLLVVGADAVLSIIKGAMNQLTREERVNYTQSQGLRTSTNVSDILASQKKYAETINPNNKTSIFCLLEKSVEYAKKQPTYELPLYWPPKHKVLFTAISMTKYAKVVNDMPEYSSMQAIQNLGTDMEFAKIQQEEGEECRISDLLFNFTGAIKGVDLVSLFTAPAGGFPFRSQYIECFAEEDQNLFHALKKTMPTLLTVMQEQSLPLETALQYVAPTYQALITEVINKLQANNPGMKKMLGYLHTEFVRILSLWTQQSISAHASQVTPSEADIATYVEQYNATLTGLQAEHVEQQKQLINAKILTEIVEEVQNTEVKSENGGPSPTLKNFVFRLQAHGITMAGVTPTVTLSIAQITRLILAEHNPEDTNLIELLSEAQKRIFTALFNSMPKFNQQYGIEETAFIKREILLHSFIFDVLKQINNNGNTPKLLDTLEIALMHSLQAKFNTTLAADKGASARLKGHSVRFKEAFHTYLRKPTPATTTATPLLALRDRKTCYIAHTEKPNGCPDGLGALLAAHSLTLPADEVAFGTISANADNPFFLKQANQLVDEMIKAGFDEFVFMDVTPHVEIIAKLLAVGCKVRVLDHHASNIDLLKNKFPEFKFIQKGKRVTMVGPNLDVEINEEYSGAELSYRRLHKLKDQDPVPHYISLLGAMDLSTAPYPHDVEHFHATDADFSPKSLEKLAIAKKSTQSSFVQKHIKFYVLASIVDMQLQLLNKKHKEQMTTARLDEAKEYFEQSFEDILNGKVPNKTGELKDAFEMFQEQIQYQQTRIANGKLLPLAAAFPDACPHDLIDTVFVADLDNETGRTLETLAADYIKKMCSGHILGKTIAAFMQLSVAAENQFPTPPEKSAPAAFMKCSYRWIGSAPQQQINVGKIATKLGGGGRVSAAAGPLTPARAETLHTAFQEQACLLRTDAARAEAIGQLPMREPLLLGEQPTHTEANDPEELAKRRVNSMMRLLGQ